MRCAANYLSHRERSKNVLHVFRVRAAAISTSFNPNLLHVVKILPSARGESYEMGGL
jgi:hypothetical protein